MGRRKNGVPPPVILLISPTQFATKFMTQTDKPQIAARLKIRKVGEHGGFEVPVTIQNPEYKPEKAMEGDGKKKHHLFGKKARKIIRGATKAAEIGATGVLVGFFGICEFTPRVPPRGSRTLPDTWGARILGHGESNARVGSTCKWND